MTARVERLGLVATLMMAIVSVISLVSWFFDKWRALAFGPDYVPMAPVTAVLFAAVAATLLWQHFAPEHRATLGLLRGSVSVVVTVAALVLLQSWFGFTLPWDTPGIILVGPGIPVGRMSPTTAVAFLLSSLALAASRKRDDVGSRTIAVSAGASLLIGLVVVAGYAVDTPIEYGSGRVPMALLTAVGFIFMNASLLAQNRVVALARSRLGFGDELTRSADRSFAVRLAATLIALLNLIGLAGLSYMRNELDQVRDAVWRELDGVAEQKARELSQWREERLAEGRFLQRTPQISRDIRTFLAQPDDAAARALVVGWLDPIRGGDRYSGALVFDDRGRLKLAVPENTLAIGERIEPPLFQPPFLGPVHRDGPNGLLQIDLHVPLADNRPIGTVVLRVDPKRHLFPLAERWTTRLRSAETVLARREGDRVVYLNNLRHQSDSALRTSFPVTSLHLPAAMAARGELGPREGLDYRGEPVISSARLVSGSSWLLIAKIDQAEAYMPLRTEAWRSGLLLVLILLSVALAAAYLWRERSATSLTKALAAEKERLALADRLAALMRNANDIILLLDSDGRVLEANERAVAAYGYPLHELVTMTTTDFRPDGDAAFFAERVREMTAADGARFESVHRRKDGSTFDVEISSRAVTFGDRQVILAVHRDISERKAHVRQIERLTRLYAALSHVNQAIVHASDPGLLLKEACRAVVTFGGFRMAWVGRVDGPASDVTKVAEFGDETGYLGSIRLSTEAGPEGLGPTGTAIRENRTDVCGDVATDPRMAPWRDAAMRAGYRSSIALPLRLRGGAPGALTVYASEPHFFGPEEIALLEEVATDISYGKQALEAQEKRRQAEAATAEARRTVNRLSEAMDQIPAYIYMKDRDRRYTYANRPGLALFKRTPETLPGTRDVDLFPPETVAILQALDSRVIDEGRDTAEQVTVTHEDGSRRIYWEIKTPIYEDADRLRIAGLCGISTDITNIKETEAALRVSEERHRLLADNATDVIWTTDSEGRFTYVSPSIEKRRGFTPAEVISQPFTASLTPASALVASARYRKVKEEMAAGRPFEPFTLEIEQPCKDGSTVWSELSVSGIVDAEGRFVGALGVSRDIGERRRTQERLAAQLDELLRWQGAMLNREGRVRELKREVNELSARLGRPQPYASQEPAASAERVDPVS